LTAVEGAPFALTLPPNTLTVDGSGRFLYVLHLAAISAFAINPSTGELSTIAGSPFPAGQALFGLAADPFGRFLFTSDYVQRVAMSLSRFMYMWEPTLSGTALFKIDCFTGSLGFGGAPFIGAGPFTADPTGRFIVTSGRGSGEFSESSHRLALPDIVRRRARA
jgi:hypothetical protein